MEYHQLTLEIAIKLGNKWEEGNAHCQLGIVYKYLSDFK